MKELGHEIMNKHVTSIVSGTNYFFFAFILMDGVNPLHGNCSNSAYIWAVFNIQTPGLSLFKNIRLTTLMQCWNGEKCDGGKI